MKNIILLTALAWASNSFTLEVRAMEDTNQTPMVASTSSGATTNEPARSEENLGYDIVDGKTNKIGSIYKVTPSYVQVIYASRTGARKIPRQELPPELAAKFPYDAAKAAEYQKQQIELAAQQAAAARATARADEVRKEQEIANEIAALKEQDVAIQKELGILKHLPAGNGRHLRASHLSNQQQAIREQISRLKTQLEQLQMQRARIF